MTTYPQVIGENTFEEDNKKFLNLEIQTEPGTTNKIIKKLNRNKIFVKGFRVGKVPKEVMERVVGRDQIYVEEMSKKYNDVCRVKEYNTVTDPDLVGWNEEADGSLKFKVKVEVFDDFSIEDKDYLGIEVERDVIDDNKVEDAYENYLKSLEKQQGSYKPLERACQVGDYILIDLELKLDDKLKEEFSAKQEFIQLEEKTLGKEIVAAIVGTNAGETKTVDFTFGEDHPNNEFKNKPAQITFTLTSVKEQVLHARDDEMANQAGLQVNTLDELKIKFVDEYKKSQEQMIDRIFELSCMEKVLQNINLNIPQTMITNEVKSLLQHRYNTLEQMGYPKEKIFENMDFKLVNEQAKNRIAAALIFNKLFKKNVYKLDDVSNDDISTSIKEKIEMNQKPEEEIKKHYEDENNLRMLKKEILYDRFVKNVIDSAKPIPRKEKTPEVNVTAEVIENNNQAQ